MSISFRPLWLFILTLLLSSGVTFGAGYFLATHQTSESTMLSPILGVNEEKQKDTRLQRYSFNEIAKRQPVASPITIEKVITKNDDFTGYLFSYKSEGGKITGLMNVPNQDTTTEKPVIIMLRGFVHEDIYQTGVGTQRAGEELARAGYITLAPDYLGFGESDPQPADSLEARFIKPINAIDLISSVQNFNLQPLIFENKTIGRMNGNRIGIWAHSNGGQIALSLLEITFQKYPTVLWAPVTKPFPYSVLYFTDESDDLGKTLRNLLANFEKDYNIDDFTIGLHWEKIIAPIQLHQGTKDDAVPKEWSDEFVKTMEKVNQENPVEYFTYSGADHNLQPGWGTAMQRTKEFFREKI